MRCEQRTTFWYMGEIRNTEALKDSLEINDSWFSEHLRFYNRINDIFDYFLWNSSTRFWSCLYEPKTNKIVCGKRIAPEIKKMFPTVIWGLAYKCAPDLRFRIITDIGYGYKK